MAGQWFSPGPPVSSTDKTDCHDIIEILLKMAVNQTKPIYSGGMLQSSVYIDYDETG